MKRVKRVDPNPNPLFVKWLNEFREEWVRKQNLPMVKIYNLCIESLEKYPLPLASGKHCFVLTGFGKTICARLDEKLADHHRHSENREELDEKLADHHRHSENREELDEKFVEHHRQSEKQKVDPNFPISPLRALENIRSSSPEKSILVKSHLAEKMDTIPQPQLQDEEDEELQEALQLSQRSFEVESNKRKLSEHDSPAKYLRTELSLEDRIQGQSVEDRQIKVPGKKLLSSVFDDSDDDEQIYQQRPPRDQQQLIKEQLKQRAKEQQQRFKAQQGGNVKGAQRQPDEEQRTQEEQQQTQKEEHRTQEERQRQSEDRQRQLEEQQRTQEDEDIELALRLSQEDADLNDSRVSVRSQEDADLEFARQLQEQFNAEQGQGQGPRDELLPSPNASYRSPSPTLTPPSYRSPSPTLTPPPAYILDNEARIPAYDQSTVEKIEDFGIASPPRTTISELLANDPVFTRRVVSPASGRSPATGRGGRGRGEERRGRGRGGGRGKKKGAAASEVSDTSAHEGERYPAMSAVSRLLANDPVFNRRGGGRGGRGGGGRAKRNHGLAVEMGLEDDLDDNLGASQASSVGSPNTSKKGGKRSKEYVPKTRSGAYAVLLTLYEWSKKPDYVGYMRKAELQTHAQPLSDQPFNIQNAHSEFYTAWSGVNTLMKHALMTKWSNPCKYNITEKGMELAMRISNTENNLNLSQQAHTSRSGRSLMEDTPRAGTSTVTSQSIRDEAPLRVTPDKRSSAANFSMNLDDLSFSESFHEPGFSQAGPSSTPGFSQAGPSSTLGFSQAGPSRSLSRHLTDVEDDLLNPGLLLQKNIQKNMLLEVQPSCGLRHQPEFRLVPGRFEILLCVDNTETAGGGVGGRKTLKAETVRHLAECGVAYDRRNLNIGDFLWIAREKIAAIPGQFQQRAPRELVLPYIVERKRLDDLWASVKDGRYEEQKFRMKSSGLTNLYYLIEDYSVQKQNWGQAARGQMVTSEAIQQAICNTAVQEGFTVVKTKDQRATIEHLTLFTRILQNKYKDSTLASCTQADFADGLVTDRETSLLTFPELNSAARKNRKMTLKEIFAKMLLRLKGLSVDMAQGLVEEFPTPTQFRDALLSVDTIDQRIKLIQDVSVGLQSKRKITRPLAEALAKFWTQLDLN